jgi:acyl-CoA synthetase (AMP-forming)/AMP-acid ligase II
MDGYYKRERGEVFTTDGWFPTGDRVHINADGTLFFHGRHSEMIKTGGANVAPREVEDALQRLPGVREATVFGCPDDLKGEVVVAVVVARDGADVDPAELIAKLRSDISAYKVPQQIVVMDFDAIPRTDSGKPKKNLLKERVLARSA